MCVVNDTDLPIPVHANRTVAMPQLQSSCFLGTTEVCSLSPAIGYDILPT